MMDDLISRPEITEEAVKEYCRKRCLIVVTSDFYAEMMKRWKKEEPHWIPCSERLPERPEQMLVYARNTHFSIAKYKEVRKGVNDYIYTWVTDNAFDVPHEVKNVVAWMPLPEPYKGR